MSSLLWVVVLLALGLTVMVLEVFLPSGGILGFLSVTAIIAAIATAFLEQGPVVGMMVLAIATIVVPVVLALAFRWFPATPLGRRVLPPPPDARELLPDAPSRRRLHELVGRTGLATSEMLPWGVVEIDGTRFDAMSECGPIPEGAAVVAVAAQGRALVVSLAAEAERAGGLSLPEPLRPFPPEKAVPDEKAGLSPTLEGFEFDGLDPPSA